MRGPQLLLASLSLVAVACGPQRWVKKGADELSQNHPNAAARAYERALQKDPSLPAALRGLAASHLAREEPVRAVLPAQRAVRAGDEEAVAILAEALIQTGRAKDALTALDKALANNPGHHAWLRLSVEAHLSSGDQASAAKQSDKLIGVERASAQAMRGWALVRAGQNTAAADTAAKLVALAPQSARYQAEAAAIFRETGQAGPLAVARDIARSNLPSSPADFLKDAKYRASNGDLEGALRRLSWARALYPLNSEVPRQLGLLCTQVGDWSRAVRELSAALKMPPYAAKRSVHAVVVAHAGDIGRESRRRSAVVEMATKLGESHAQMGQKAQAASAWQLAVDSNPSAKISDYIAVAKAWELAGEIDRMGAMARTASQLAPRDAQAQHAMSRALAASGNLNAAIGYGQRAWDLAPRDIAIAVYLGDLYERRNDKTAARQVYQAALKYNPGDTRLLLGLRRASR